MRAPTQATPFVFAFSIAVMVANRITRWPMPLSPSTSAVAGFSCTMRMFGRGLLPPAFSRLTLTAQADDAMGVGAAQIGLDHEAGDDVGIGGGKPGRLQRALGEGLQVRRHDARDVRVFAVLFGRVIAGVAAISVSRRPRSTGSTALSCGHITSSATRSAVISSSRATPHSAMLRASSSRR